jgi:7-keto-8-aminopelargonate synthetase-like enzyme
LECAVNKVNERNCCYEAKYNFRLLVDDAHGFGTLGETGAGAGEGVQDDIDVTSLLCKIDG